MASTLLFFVVLAAIAGWWLSKQGLMQKPWLEQGVGGDVPLPNTISHSSSKVGLGIFLAVAGTLFALVISAYSMRMQQADWQALPVPGILWLNTGMLLLSSIALHRAQISARRQQMDETRISLLAAGISALAFLSGQILAWKQLVSGGYILSGNPANTFFYILTGAHGLHLLGGLVALGRTIQKAWRVDNSRRLALSVELCAIYWHFMLLVWLVIFGIVTGWANRLVDICRQLLT